MTAEAIKALEELEFKEVGKENLENLPSYLRFGRAYSHENGVVTSVVDESKHIVITDKNGKYRDNFNYGSIPYETFVRALESCLR